jgi:ankyrin repeat protein
MKSTCHKRVFPVCVVVLVLLIAVPLGLTWRHVRQERLNWALINAVSRNDDRAIVSLLNQGADANCRDQPSRKVSLWQALTQMIRGRPPQPPHGLTPLLIAVEGTNAKQRSNNYEVPPENVRLVRALLDHGARVNVADEDGDTPLILAARNGFLDSARCLLDHGAQVNFTRCCHTALVEAIRWGEEKNRDHFDLCRLLLQRGADPNLQAQGDDLTPLMCAIYGQHEYAARLLLEWRADVNVGWKEHTTTALDCAYYHLPSFVPVLKQAGAKESP